MRCRLSVSPLKVVTELSFEVGPSIDGGFPKIVRLGSSQIREVDGEVLNHEVRIQHRCSLRGEKIVD